MSSSIVTNLYFRFEIQQASISVSALKCDPYDDSVTLDGLNSELEKLKSTPDRLDDIDSKLEELNNTPDRLDELDSKVEELENNTDRLDDLYSQVEELNVSKVKLVT